MAGKKRGSASPRGTPPPGVTQQPGSSQARRSVRNQRDAMQYFAMATVAVLAVAIGTQYLYHIYVYLPGRITTKTDLPAIDWSSDPKVWGSYRSHMYFGLRTKHPNSPLFGMLWYEQPGMNMMVPPVRHWCDKDGGVNVYSFTEADGRSFGKQTIVDGKLIIQTDWVNSGHSWAARITTFSKEASDYAFLFYFALQDASSKLHPVYRDSELESFTGFSPVLGNFSFTLMSHADISSRSFLSLKLQPYPDPSKIKEAILPTTIVDREQQQLRLPSGFVEHAFEDNPNLIAIQLNVPSNSTIQFAFSGDDEVQIKGDDFERILDERVELFNKKFEDAFGLAAQGYSPFHQEMGRAALSNMLGSIGYSYGYNRVQSQYSSKELLYGPHALLSACPCRSTFPRGFLWDEGFHHLLFRKFDHTLSLEILSSWLDTMNVDGWIPREMILGEEAELLVPAEFMVQRDSVANPPMFFYTLQRFLNDEQLAKSSSSALVKLYPRLRLWYSWLNVTQAGPKPGTYRWRGRNATTSLELNPKTLPSGLDDFPRATHPSKNEYHLDLRSWMAVSAQVLSKLANLAGDSAGEALFTADAAYLSDFNRLNELHWSNKVNRYCDFGMHSTMVALERPAVPLKQKNVNAPPPPPPPKKRTVKVPPSLGLVENTFGYISLYPVMLRLVPHDSDKLGIVLESMRSEKELWSKYGLRSISPSSPYYKAYNTEHDPPYWRGAIWINMNYMMISALKYYSTLSGPYQDLAYKTYSELRNNVITNVAREYKRTGNLWESYDDETGQGRGAHPFTGWSALVLSIMAEQYD